MTINKSFSKMSFFSRFFFSFFVIFLVACEAEVEGETLKKALSEDLDWKRTTTENFILHAPSRTFAAEKINSLEKKVEASRQRVMERLQVVKQEKPPILIFVESREQMKKITGHASGGWTVVEENGIFLVANDSVYPPIQHELGHLYSWRSWGNPAGYWLSEGVAVSAAGNCAGTNLHAWAAKLYSEDKLTDFGNLEREFDFSKAAPHLQAGSFVKYVMDKYGVRSFRMIWEGGLAASSEATGLEKDALLENWGRHILQNEFTAAAQFLELEGKISCETN